MSEKVGHTPGPWFFSRVEDAVVQEGSPKTICDIPIQASRATDALNGDTAATDEDKANASLIAAAPELLAACKRAKRILESFGVRVTWPQDIDFEAKDFTFAVVVGETLGDIEYALAKAKGVS